MDKKKEYQRPRLETYGGVEELTRKNPPGTEAKVAGTKDMAFIESLQEHGGSNP
jgi:hypothetical protein